MIGRRREPDANGWFSEKLEPGDYVRVAPINNADGSPLTDEQRAKWWTKPYWLVCSPNGHACSLANHEVVEHEDRTITVSPSILIRGRDNVELWHGYLERGVWRTV